MKDHDYKVINILGFLKEFHYLVSISSCNYEHHVALDNVSLFFTSLLKSLKEYFLLFANYLNEEVSMK